MSTLEVARVPILSDNYVWLLHDPASADTVVIDPGEAAPVLAALDQRGWRATAIWNTHWHPDHTGGNADVKAATGAPVFAPTAEAARIPATDHGLAEGDTVAIGGVRARVWETPGHTLGHIVFVLPGLAFTGDTLFAMGCGRLFEGTPDQMHASLQRLATLPDDTMIYCAHEYTLSNARFAANVEPDNAAIAARLAKVEAARAAGQPTIPTSMAEERATNPFLRATDAAHFAALREGKDRFRG